MEPATDAERTAELREQIRLFDLRDLRGAEFLRLLNLAHTEGLLAELIQASALGGRQGLNRQHATAALADPVAQKTQSTRLPELGLDCPLNASELLLREPLSQSTALA